MMVMSLNMAYPLWNAPLATILSKQLNECRRRTPCDSSFDFAVRSIFSIARRHLIQRTIQKLHGLLQKVHVLSPSNARKLKLLNEGRRPPFEEARMFRSTILALSFFLGLALLSVPSRVAAQAQYI